MENDLTPWFEAKVKPVHVGIYERNYAGPRSIYDFDYWDGIQWLYSYDGKTPSRNVAASTLKWRGLASRPR